VNLGQLIAFAFVVGWISGEVACGTYREKLTAAITIALIIAYLNNTHIALWKKLKNLFNKHLSTK
jgi:hypothetical protein